MSREWESGCKRCGRELVKYSDRSYIYSLQFGFARPEYCPDCQIEEVENRGDLGMPYFYITVDDSTISEGIFGELNHPGVNHKLIETEGSFDPSRFGLTPSKIKDLADFFSNPQHRVAVVVGPTGSGKSTALPYWMVYPPKETGLKPDHFTRDGQILHTQPRILSAKGQAKYVGEDLMGGHTGAGFDAGFKYSQNDESDWRNAWVTETDGLFINEIIQGKIGNYGYVIIDEAHERSLNIDKIICLLKERLSLYPKLKIIIASATINAQAFCDFFGSGVAGIIEFEGKERVDENHNPVSYKVIYQGDLGEKTIFPYDDLRKLGKIIVDEAVNKSLWLVKEILTDKKPRGDILVFLQGVDPIDDAVKKTKALLENEGQNGLVEVFPLYRDLSDDDKEKATKHNLNDGKIHIIFSTNIAEASVTIDSLGYEVETGIENQSVFDSNTETTKVPLTLISKANSKQRWGRTGRTRNGEVYCLYTQKQFDEIFLEYPISAIKRSSMEELLLDMKTAGINDPTIGWLENPDTGEINRSKEVLINIGALSSEGNLSNKGLMLRNFSYSAKLVEALLLSDEMGCLVEMASIISAIKNGGNRKLLDWQYDWDSYTKYNAYVHHKALMSGCKDDIDFIIKIIKFWTELPFTNRDEVATEDLLNSSRQQWAEQNYLNTETIQSIISERDGLLNQFYEQSGEQDFRKIELILLNRVRSILYLIFPEIQDSIQNGIYQYDQMAKPKDQSQINCNCLLTHKAESTWMNVMEDTNETEEYLFSCLMIDQFYPIGSKFLTTKLSSEKEGITITVNYPENQNTDLSESTEVKVVGYASEKTPTVLTEIINPPEPFDLFLKKYKVGDDLKVEVLELLNYPNDRSPVLITQELSTKVKIFINTNDLTFSNSSNAVALIPIGSILDVQAKQIDIDKHWINISMYKLTEKLLNEKLFARGKEESQTVIAHVFRIETENVHFLLDWANPSIGYLPIIIIFGDRLSKKPEEFTIGEEVLLSVYRGIKVNKFPFPDISEKLESKFINDKKPSGLYYHNQILKYDGRMPLDISKSLKTLDQDPEFHQAIEKIYWLSNRIYLDRFLELDVEWVNDTKTKFPINGVVNGVIQKVIPQSGVTLLIDGIYEAFLPRRQLLSCFRDNLSESFKSGDVILSQITEIKYDSKQLILKQITEEERPIISTPISPSVDVQKNKTKSVTKEIPPIETIPKPKIVPASTQKKSPTSSKTNTDKIPQTTTAANSPKKNTTQPPQTPLTATDITLMIVFGAFIVAIIIFVFVFTNHQIKIHP